MLITKLFDNAAHLTILKIKDVIYIYTKRKFQKL